jgi:AraC-like DNA-binding protein
VRSEETEREHQLLFRQATVLIEQALGDRDLSLTPVAHELAISPRQLQRVFDEIGGESFSAYLLRVRIERALRLLDSGMPARLVAAHVGYSSGSALHKAMRRRPAAED